MLYTECSYKCKSYTKPYTHKPIPYNLSLWASYDLPIACILDISDYVTVVSWWTKLNCMYKKDKMSCQRINCDSDSHQFILVQIDRRPWQPCIHHTDSAAISEIGPSQKNQSNWELSNAMRYITLIQESIWFDFIYLNLDGVAAKV